MYVLITTTFVVISAWPLESLHHNGMFSHKHINICLRLRFGKLHLILNNIRVLKLNFGVSLVVDFLARVLRVYKLTIVVCVYDRLRVFVYVCDLSAFDQNRWE